MTDCAEITCCMGQGCMNGNTRPDSIRRNGIAPRILCGKGVLQIFFEVFFGESQMHRLYLYYCYQLGILPKKQQPHINRPELERIWKDTEKILAEHAFVHDHKFPSLQAIVDYRKGLSQQIECPCRTACGSRQADAPKGCSAGTGRPPYNAYL